MFANNLLNEKSFSQVQYYFFFIFSDCTNYVQILNVIFNKSLKNKISELTDLSYEENLKK